MGRTFASIVKWAAAAAVAAFLVFGWVTLTRGAAGHGKVVLRIWDWWNPAGNAKLGRFFDKVKGDFEASHPNIEIRYQFIPLGPQYIQKLMSAFAAGDPPDAFQCSIIWATDLYDRGVIRDLNDFLAESTDVRPDRFYPLCSAYTSRDGHVFGIPTSMDAYALIINTKMAREAGLDPSPYAIDSWDTFLEYAQRLTIRDETGRVTRAGFLVSAVPERFSGILPWMAADGKAFLTDDLRSTNATGPAGLKAMQFLYDLLHKHNVSFPPGGETQELSLFEQGKAAMILGGTWNGYHISENAPDLEYVMTSLPPGPDSEKRATITWANMMMVPKNSRHPRETWEYLRYYGGLQASIDMLEILYRNSARLDLYDTPQWKAQVAAHPYLKMVPEIAASGAMYPYKRFEEVNDAFKPYYQMAILGSMPVEEAMKEGNAKAERILAGSWADELLRKEKASEALPEAVR